MNENQNNLNGFNNVPNVNPVPNNIGIPVQPIQQDNFISGVQPNVQPQMVEQPVTPAQPVVQQPVVVQQVTIQQPVSGTVGSPSTTNPQPKKSKVGLIIGIIIILLVLCGGIFLGTTLLGNKDNDKTNKEDNVVENKKEEKKKETYINFSESTETNNLAITLRWGKGHYVIKFNGEGLGNPFSKTYEKIEATETYLMYNDAIKVLSYFNPISDPETRIYNLWGFGYMAISVEKYNAKYISGSTDYIQYITEANSGDYYLVNSKWISSGSSSYYIKILKDDDVIQIYLGNMELTQAKEIFNKYVSSSEIAYVPIDDDYNILPAVTHENGTVEVDTSNWTFINTLIGNYYKKGGMKVKNTTQITGFNTTAYRLDAKNSMYLTPVYDIDGTLYNAGVTIWGINKESFENIVIEKNRSDYSKDLYANMKKIDTEPFKNTYVYESGRAAKMYVETYDGGYYVIDSGFDYRDNDEDGKYTKQLIKIVNQVFN